MCNAILQNETPHCPAMPSLRGKIRLTYSSLAMIVVTLCGIAVFDLMFLERQVHEGIAVSDLNNAVLEMRRQEKNLFLYGDPNALGNTEMHAEAALAILRNEHEALATVSTTQLLGTLAVSIEAYRAALANWREQRVMRSNLEVDLREQGQQISSLVDGIAHSERLALASAVRKSRSWLLLSIVAVGVLVFLVGRHLALAVVTPLRRLERNLAPIAAGRFDHLEAGSRDREFVAFTEAFNRMLRELDTRRRRMLQAEKLASLGVLVAGVAHELNNPLANISSSCQLLLEELESANPEQLATWLRQIDGETERARQIVLALLEFGRQRELSLEPVPLLELLDKTRMLLGNNLRSSAAQLDIEVPGDLVVHADPHRLQQVFINLLRNAMDAGGTGVRIRILARNCSAAQDTLPAGAQVLGEPDCHLPADQNCTEILVEDNGPGIPADVLPQVFDPFFTTREPGKGMGLGMYIIQEIILEHGGCIAVNTLPESGTRITIRLPREDRKA
jgi:two-component system NtrC family sensor kinase